MSVKTTPLSPADYLDTPALREIDASQLATKADLKEVEAKIETSAANLKVDILRWLVVTQIALGGFLFAAMRLTK